MTMQGGGSLREGSPAPRETQPEGRDWRAIAAVVVAIALLILLMPGCGVRSPLAEPGPVITREVRVVTPNGSEVLVEKTRAAAELEYRLRELEVKLAQARARVLAGGHYDSRGRWVVDPYGGCYHTYGGRLVC